MNDEQRFAREICRHLDLEAERLPRLISQRLSSARMAALAALPADASSASVPGSGTFTGASPRTAPGRSSAVRRPARPDRATSGWWHSSLGRLTWAAVPALLLILFIVPFGGSGGSGDEEVAEVDAALLTDGDDVPVTAWADQGFGAYMRKTLHDDSDHKPVDGRRSAVWR